jgi:hypothetical protein
LFIPVGGNDAALRARETEAICALRPSHNIKDNPSPQITKSVTTSFGFSVKWNVWTTRDIADGIRMEARRRGCSPNDFIREAVQEAIARGNGLTIKEPPVPRDGRRKAVAA